MQIHTLQELPLFFGLLCFDSNVNWDWVGITAYFGIITPGLWWKPRNQCVLHLMQMETLQELLLVLKNFHLTRKFIAHHLRERERTNIIIIWQLCCCRWWRLRWCWSSWSRPTWCWSSWSRPTWSAPGPKPVMRVGSEQENLSQVLVVVIIVDHHHYLYHYQYFHHHHNWSVSQSILSSWVILMENLLQEKYDSYLTKLQNICTEQVTMIIIDNFDNWW